MFSSTTLFKKVACPELSTCSLLNCIFSHQILPLIKKNSNIPLSFADPQNEEKAVVHNDAGYQEDLDQHHRPRKKPRIEKRETDNRKEMAEEQGEKGGTAMDVENYLVGSRKGLESSSMTSTVSGARKKAQATTVETFRSIDATSRIELAPIKNNKTQSHGASSHVLAKPSEDTLKRKRTSPQDGEITSKGKTQNPSCEPAPPANPTQKYIKATLNPRMIPNPPASHTIRIRLLTLLHHYITKLNDQTKLLNNPSLTPIIMSSEEVVVMSLDIEEKVARENSSVYENVLKQRAAGYSRMTVEEWQRERYTRNPRPNAISIVNPNPPQRVDTGLSAEAELTFLSRIHATQAWLSEGNYVTSPPTRPEMDAAAQGVEAAHNWEVCVRCEARFQAFPGRRAEDGVLTTGGRCHFHDGKRCRLAGGEFGWSCCKAPQGTNGCRDVASHVFKVTDAKRLAAAMQFMATPENPARLSDDAVAMDCEMGYTSFGLELVRLTAVSWPSGRPLLDVLVRPLGEILDFNSRFSGVWPETYVEALNALDPSSVPAGDQNPTPRRAAKKPLPLMRSPAEARALLFKYISPTTPLIGHALENDLRAMRIIHPCIVDTVDLFPHSQGLPKRNSLKMLTSIRLDWNIQEGFSGHDSHIDARAAGELVRVKIREEVEKWKATGWKVEDGKFPSL